MRNLEIIKTEDGSFTIKDHNLDEIYHSVYGAVNESEHVFIDAALHALPEKLDDIRILEVGLGTGLNALLTFREQQRKGWDIHYVSLEPYPLAADILAKINYPDFLGMDETFFQKIHDAYRMGGERPGPGFHIEVYKQKIEDAVLANEYFDVVYYDAFSPPVQPEVWTEEIFSKIACAMKPGGILVTYSSRGTVKRALKAAGLFIEKIPGPKGKRDMLRATKAVSTVD